MKILLFIGIIAVLLLNSCNNQKFYEVQNPHETGLIETGQIFPAKKGILKSVGYDGEQPPRLQLFNTKGNLLHEISMEHRPFKIIDWKDNLITIELIVNSTWPETNNHKELKLGDNRIFFTYKRISGYSALERVLVDSFSINRHNYSVKLFFKDTLRDEFPISNLSFSSYSLCDVKRNNGRIFGEEYVFTDEKSITSYLKGILAMYD